MRVQLIIINNGFEAFKKQHFYIGAPSEIGVGTRDIFFYSYLLCQHEILADLCIVISTKQLNDIAAIIWRLTVFWERFVDGNPVQCAQILHLSLA